MVHELIDQAANHTFVAHWDSSDTHMGCSQGNHISHCSLHFTFLNKISSDESSRAHTNYIKFTIEFLVVLDLFADFMRDFFKVCGHGLEFTPSSGDTSSMGTCSFLDIHFYIEFISFAFVSKSRNNGSWNLFSSLSERDSIFIEIVGVERGIMVLPIFHILNLFLIVEEFVEWAVMMVLFPYLQIVFNMVDNLMLCLHGPVPSLMEKEEWILLEVVDEMVK